MNNIININRFSNFWFDDDHDAVDKFLGVEEKKKGKDLIALAGYRRAISNFVSIVTSKNIPIKFNSKDYGTSHTNGKEITISANINDKKFDVAVGLALHEGSHIKLSDFQLMSNLETMIPPIYYSRAKHKTEYNNIDITSHIKSLLNWVEDRRIDNYIFKTSPGYKGYYHSMYTKYFYSRVIDKALKCDEYTAENWESYLFRIINIHNSNRNLNALKGLKDIWTIIDLKNIDRLKSTADALKVALDIYEVILNNISDVKTNKSSNGKSRKVKVTDKEVEDLIDNVNNDNSEGMTSEGLDIDGTESNTSNGSSKSKEVTLSDRQKELLKKAFNNQKQFLDNNVRKTMLSKKDAQHLNAIEESGATYKKVGKDVTWSKNGIKALVVKKLTKSLIESNQFGIMRTYQGDRYDNKFSDYNFVEEGIRLGTILGRKLKVRSEEKTLKYSRKDSGKIDRRLIAELGFGNGNIFSQTFVDKYNKAHLHISVDASGSMNGKNWNKAMTSTVAMIKAADMAGNIHIIVTVRSTHRPDHSYRTNSPELPLIVVVYDSKKDNISKVRNLFKYLGTSGTTPEGLTFEAIMDELIPTDNNTDSYFVNYSDGMPMFHSNDICYNGSGAVNHTRKMVDKIKCKGIKVLSYFIGGDNYSSSDTTRRDFKQMYGKDSHFINATNMMEVARTMNKKFIEK